MTPKFRNSEPVFSDLPKCNRQAKRAWPLTLPMNTADMPLFLNYTALIKKIKEPDILKSLIYNHHIFRKHEDKFDFLKKRFIEISLFQGVK